MVDKKTEKRLINIIAHQYQPEKSREATDPDAVASRLEGPVAPGQLWEVDDRETHAMAFVCGIPEDDRRLVRVIPVGDYDNGYDSRDLVILPTGSPTGFPLIAYKQFETTIPVRLLSVPYGSFDGQTVAAIRSFVGKFDPDDEDGATLSDRLNIQDRFERWHARCGRLPELRNVSEDGFAVSRDLSGYLEALRTVLGLAPAQCLAVRRGTLTLTDEQEKRMEEAGFGNRPRTTGALPRSFVELSEQPRWRFVADEYIDRHGDPSMSSFDADGAARGMLARRAFALAARANGTGDEAVMGMMAKAAGTMTERTDDDR